ncbi:MAG: TIGR02147 family protein [Bdellovibrionales bacterium]
METHHLLQKELARRCQANPNYSLRAFAQALGLSPATVSMVLSGKRQLSKLAKQKVAERLGLSVEDRQIFLGDRQNRSEIKAQNFHLMALDSFAVISDWYHLAILSLLEVDKLALTAPSIARYLGIHEHEAKAAMARLERLNLIEKKQGRWKQKGKAIAFNNTNSTAATIRFNRQILEQAIRSIENDPFERRAMSASTFEMDSKLVPMAREELKKWRRTTSERWRKTGHADQVYCLAVQLFPLSRIINKKRGVKNEKK